MLLLGHVPRPFPRHHYPRPQTHNAGATRVTAIAGFNCTDGVVIAADTEESYGDDKAYTHKLFPLERKNSRLCVAGSGLGYLIDYANEAVVSALDSGIKTVTEFESSLIGVLDELYRDKFTRYPVESPTELRIQLLVGVQFAEETNPPAWAHPALFECQSNLVTPIRRRRHSCVLGAGELLKEIATQFAGWGLTTSLAEWASIYIIHEAKRRFGGVGGKTHTFVMKTDGNFAYGLGKNLTEKESILDGFARACQLFMLSLDPSVPDDRAKDFVDGGTEWLRNARRYLQKMEREQGKAKHTSITINSREIEKMMRHLRSATRLASRTSEPGR